MQEKYIRIKNNIYNISPIGVILCGVVKIGFENIEYIQWYA